MVKAPVLLVAFLSVVLSQDLSALRVQGNTIVNANGQKVRLDLNLDTPDDHAEI